MSNQSSIASHTFSVSRCGAVVKGGKATDTVAFATACAGWQYNHTLPYGVCGHPVSTGRQVRLSVSKRANTGSWKDLRAAFSGRPARAFDMRAARMSVMALRMVWAGLFLPSCTFPGIATKLLDVLGRVDPP